MLINKCPFCTFRPGYHSCIWIWVYTPNHREKVLNAVTEELVTLSPVWKATETKHCAVWWLGCKLELSVWLKWNVITLNIPFTFKATFVACFLFVRFDRCNVHYLCAVNLNFISLIFRLCLIKFIWLSHFMIENSYRLILNNNNAIAIVIWVQIISDFCVLLWF